MNRGLFYALISIGLIAAGVAAYSLGRSLRPGPALAGTALTNPISVADLQLRAPGNTPVTLGDYANDVTAIFFGFTRCPDVCPLTMSVLAEAYRTLGEPENVDIVMVTVDPGHDTPEIAHDYASAFHPDFIGLSGSNTEVAAAAAAFYVGYNDTHAGVIHTDALMLMDRNGNYRRVYTSSDVPAIASDLADILAGADW